MSPLGAPDDEWDGPWSEIPPWFPTTGGVDGHDEPDVELADSVAEVLGGLDARHGDVLRRRLGQSPEGAETLQEIAETYNLSRERIRQVEKQALRAVRAGVKKRAWSGMDGVDRLIRRRLQTAFRSRYTAQRGWYLRSTFPEANGRVLGRLLETWGPATSDQVVRWIDAGERRREAEDRDRRRLVRIEDRWSRFLDGAIWPAPASEGGWFPASPCRVVRSEGGVRSSPKLARDVEYESSTEEHFIRLFEQSRFVAHYCEQPLRIEYPWFDRPRVYVPDFAVRLIDGRSLLVEAKPRSAWADGVNLAKWNAATRWCARHGWGFVVSDGGGHPRQLVGAADETDCALLETLTARPPAGWTQLRDRWFGSGRSWERLLATALTYGFTILRTPMELRRARRSPWIDELSRAAETGAVSTT